MGYFLKKSNRKYIVIERNEVPCSFFTKYPRQRNLISINKRYVDSNDKDFRLRHDWNSLLSDDPELLFTNYSEDYYPKADTIPKYCKDYVDKLKINIDYGTLVTSMTRLNKQKRISIGVGDFLLKTNKKTYQCQRVVMATGFQDGIRPKIAEGEELVDFYDTMKFDKKEFINKKVMIFGKGNSAMEVINFMTPYTQYIHVMSRSTIRLSYFTHYVGDVRAVNNLILDQYQLKSLDAIGEASVHNATFKKLKNGKILFNSEYDDLHPLEYDKVIIAIGFTFNKTFFPEDPLDRPIFDKKKKYPVTNSLYESINVPDLYVAGTISHYRDLRRSAGGFIHGFRYLADTVNKHMEWRYHDVPFSFKTFHLGQIMKHIIYRFNHASALYQMFGTLGDILVLDKESEKQYSQDAIEDCIGMEENNATECQEIKFKYFENIQVEYPLPGFISRDYPTKRSMQFPSMVHPEKYLALTLEYHPDFHGEKVLGDDRVADGLPNAHKSNFLHPIVREFDLRSQNVTQCFNKADCKNLLKPHQVSEHHFLEDFWGRFTIPKTHLIPFKKYFTGVLNKKPHYKVKFHSFKEDKSLRDVAENLMKVPLTNMNKKDEL
jgi:thioredoxin reductase